MENIKLTAKRKEILTLMGFNNIIDALRYYPYRYEYYKDEPLTLKKHECKVCVEGKIISSPKETNIKANLKKTTLKIKCKDDNILTLIFFNQFKNKTFLKLDSRIVVIGKYNAFLNEIYVNSFFLGSLNNLEKYEPVYSLPLAIKDYTYKKFIEYLFKEGCKLDSLNDKIPSKFINKYQLGTLKDALYFKHFLKNEDELKKANRYLKYEELLNFSVMGYLKRNENNKSINYAKKINKEVVINFIRNLPFKLSNDQVKVSKEILNDLISKNKMNRLLQGDVGSGKTIVSFISAFALAYSKYQVCLMAPTEILAKQHYESIKELLKNYDIKVDLLVSDLKKSEKEIIVEKLKQGQIDIIIGTHSLISDNVSFLNLGLVIIDEQHRFGVKQRVDLLNKGEMADILYMSATPIPRTLASTLYLDMDVSTIENYPIAKRNIKTFYFMENSISKVKSFILQYLKSKQKIYVVAPSINESNLDIASVNEIYKSWSNNFKDINITYLHGKLSIAEKEKILNDFNDGFIQVLISTTIVEVGINIKGANMMVIYNAERFGLAQIHQLRGRLARYGDIGYCYLLSDDNSNDVISRLSYLANNNDGFKIAMFDLKNRGAGELLGLKQSGKEPFVVANLIDDYNILKFANKDALEIISNKDEYQEYLDYLTNIMLNNNESVD